MHTLSSCARVVRAFGRELLLIPGAEGASWAASFFAAGIREAAAAIPR